MGEKDYTGADDAPIEQPLSPSEGEAEATIPAESIPQEGGSADSDSGSGDPEDEDGA